MDCRAPRGGWPRRHAHVRERRSDGLWSPDPEYSAQILLNDVKCCNMLLERLNYLAKIRPCSAVITVSRFKSLELRKVIDSI